MTDTNPYKTALNKAMKLCSGREFCKSDIRKKAAGWGAGKEDIEKIINVLVKEKFIDENRYAAAYVKDKFNYNKWGRVKIAAGLKMKEIPHETIKQSLESIDPGDYIRSLESLISSQRKRIKAKNQFDLKGKLMRYGLSKGFESGLLYDILGEEIG